MNIKRVGIDLAKQVFQVHGVDYQYSRRHFRSIDAQRAPDKFTRRIDAKKNEFLDPS